VLDHLLLLLDSGNLMVLKYSQVVQRFYIAAEAQLAAGGGYLSFGPSPARSPVSHTYLARCTSTERDNSALSVAMCLLFLRIHTATAAHALCAEAPHQTPSSCTVPMPCCALLCTGTSTDPDYLGACLAVSPQPTAGGDAITVAVAAKRGRIACLTVQLAADGSVQLSSPVVYALPAPRVLGASYQLMKRDMELGDIIDLVLLPPGKQQHGQAAEHLAVLSHRCAQGVRPCCRDTWGMVPSCLPSSSLCFGFLQSGESHVSSTAPVLLCVGPGKQPVSWSCSAGVVSRSSSCASWGLCQFTTARGRWALVSPCSWLTWRSVLQVCRLPFPCVGFCQARPGHFVVSWQRIAPHPSGSRECVSCD
jgi:hypothetical protein